MYSDEITGVVIDIGNQSCRAGYSGEDTPKTLFTSAVGVLPEDRVKGMEVEGAEKPKGRTIITGDLHVKKPREFMELHESNRKGQYTDYEFFEKLIHETFVNSMEIPASQYPLLMSDPSIHNKEQRQKICEIMFEKFQVPAFFMCKAGVLSCFASGRSTSLILDSGASSTQAVPVHDGYVLQKGIVKYDVAGEYLTEKIEKYIEEVLKTPIVPRHYLDVTVDGENKMVNPAENPNIHSSFDKFCKAEIARDIKESVCKLLENRSEGTMGLQEKAEYELPDGKKVNLGDFRFTSPEIFFVLPESEKARQELDIANFKGFHQLVLDSINQCDIDLRKELLSNVILTGGNTLIPGFVDLMQKKLNEIAPQNAKVKLIAYPHAIERRYSTWIGGSILSSLGSFQSMWIGKAEYDEYGSYIIEKKCP